MCRLEILLTFMVTMAATVECRSILHKTDGETNLSRLRSHRPLQYNHNTRGVRLQRPSINKSTFLKTNFPSSEILKPSWRRTILPQHTRVVGTNYPTRETFQPQREVRNRNTILRNHIVRHLTQPDIRRLTRFRQRIPHFDVRRYNSLFASALDKNLLSESDSLKQSVSGYRPTFINTKQNENVISGDLTKRTPRRKWGINLNLNTNGGSNRQVISVKAKNIRNIRLSHSSRNSIIDLHKGGHRARITFSKMLQHRPVKAETANTAGKDAPSETKVVNMTQLSNQLPIAQDILKTKNINRITPSSASSASSLSSSAPSTTAKASSLSSSASSLSSSASSLSSSALSTTATTIILGKYENTPVPNVIADKQTTNNDTSFNKTQTVIITPSEIPGANNTIVEKGVSSAPTSKPVMNDNAGITTSAKTNDVTTEEPDVADTPDVDILGLTGTAFRNKFYSDLDYD